MKKQLIRAYRKNIFAEGSLHTEEGEYPIVVVNISTTGSLVKLNDKQKKHRFTAFQKKGKFVDIDISDLALATSAQIIRIAEINQELLVALKFDEGTSNV